MHDLKPYIAMFYACKRLQGYMFLSCFDCDTDDSLPYALNNASGIGYAISQFSNVDMIGELLLNTRWHCDVDSYNSFFVHAVTACLE